MSTTPNFTPINTMSSLHPNPSICIPRTFSNVTWQLVKDAFDEIFGQGFVERVDVVNKTDRSGREFKKIFIHFHMWPSTDDAVRIKQALIDGKTIKVVYQFPWYWKCVMSNVPKRTWTGPKPYVEVIEDVSHHSSLSSQLEAMEEGNAVM